MRNNYLWYQFFRYCVVKVGLTFFYSRFKVTGRENLPKNKPIIFVPNHQNSFMDALLISVKTKPVIYYLTRAQAFNPPAVGWFIRSINMLPVYRVRDGFSSVQKNNEIFERCVGYLRQNKAVLVFPEASHDLKRRIRPLSKGFTRIAFGAAEKSNWEMDVQIIPVGLNYSKHRETRNPVHVIFGQAVSVKQFEEQYKTDEKNASQILKDQVEGIMQKLVMHVPQVEEYPFYKILLDDLEPDRSLIIEPEIMNHRVELFAKHINSERLELARETDKLAASHHVDLAELAASHSWEFRDVLLLPLYVLALINNALPYQIVRYLTQKVIKDHTFDASIKFLAGIFILPLFYGIVSLILCLSGFSFAVWGGYFLFSLLSSPLFIRAKKLLMPAPATSLKKKKPHVYKRLKEALAEFATLRQSVLNE